MNDYYRWHVFPYADDPARVQLEVVAPDGTTLKIACDRAMPRQEIDEIAESAIREHQRRSAGEDGSGE